MSRLPPLGHPDASLISFDPPLERDVPDTVARPAPPSSFVGREREVAAIQALVRRPDVRLVTLTGPGGVGKTRLAIRVAELLWDRFEDGVWFVDLASVRDPGLVPGRIAEHLELRTTAAGTPEVALKDFLRNRHLLLVLDNFEHLLGATPFIADLVHGSPCLKLLVTSRAPLHVYGEHQWQVQPLPVRSETPGSTPEVAIQVSAVRLFVDRAAAVDSAFELTPEHAGPVMEICQRLEGLPLAIELAAARVATLTPAALLKRLEPRLPMLSGGMHGQPERFRTMRSAIGWSYDLLSPEDRALFRRLSVFVGGFTVAAAESVAAEVEAGAGAVEAPLLDRLCSLLNQSLLRRSSALEDVRFSMLEVVREFALDALKASGELEKTRRWHASYYLGHVKALIPGLSGKEMAGNLARLDIELPNIRSALSWALDRGQIETALRLASDLYPFWNYRGHLAEGRSWLTAILGRAGAQPRTRINGLLAVCGIAALQGHYEVADQLCQEAADLSARESYQFGIARALLLQSIVAEWRGDYRAASAGYAECALHANDFEAEHWHSRLLALQAEVDVVLGDYARGEEHAQMSVMEAKEAGHEWNAGAATGALAYLQLMRGNVEAAVALYWENLNRYRELGDNRGLGGATGGFAGVALRLDRTPTAARLLGAARAIGDEIGVGHLGNKGLTERIDASVRAAMRPDAYQAAWDAGYALGREWALSEAESLTFEILNQPHGRPVGAAEEAGLTRREGEVLYLLARRLTDKEIADALSISPRTAMNHVANILAKLDLANRREAARWTREHGFI